MSPEIFTPIDPFILKEQMEVKPVRFAFMKKNGTMRRAIGITAVDKMPGQVKPRSGRSASPLVIPYYDIEREAWRCFRTSTRVFILS